MTGQGARPLDRSTPPVGGPARSSAFPRPDRFRLDNGLTVLAVASRRAPMVTLELLTAGGSHHNPLDRPGLARLTAALIVEGTEERSGTQLAAAVERLGGALATGASWETASIGLDLPAAHLADGLRLLAELATRATFPGAELERLRGQRLAELAQRRDLPAALADEQMVRSIYGDESPYGLITLGTRESLQALSRDEVLAFYRHFVANASEAVLIAVGDFDPDSLRGEVEAQFASLPAPAPTPRPEIALPPALPPRVIVVDRPAGTQTALRVGRVGLPRRHEDFVALRVASAILGGKFTSRLNLNLREEKGWTYGVHSSVTGRHGPGPIFVSTDIATDVAGTAAREIFRELRLLRDEPVGEEELADTLSYLIGTFPNALQSLGGIATRLESIAVHRLPDDYYDRYLAEVAGVSRERVQQVARRHLRFDDAVTVAVGPATELVSQFEELGEVTVVTPDGG